MNTIKLTEEQISLLRKFDVSQVKQGDLIYLTLTGEEVSERVYLLGPDSEDVVCARRQEGRMCLYDYNTLRLKPLFWLEGKPVYEGDELYHKNLGKVKVERLSNADGVVLVSYGKEHVKCDYLNILTLSWEDSKVEKEGWINLFRTSPEVVLTSKVFDTEEQAKECASQYGQGFSSLEAIDTVKVTWKERV